MLPVSARESPKLIIDVNVRSHEGDSHAILRIGVSDINRMRFMAVISFDVKDEEAMSEYVTTTYLRL